MRWGNSGRTAPLTFTVGKGKRQRGAVCRQNALTNQGEQKQAKLVPTDNCLVLRLSKYLAAISHRSNVRHIVLVFCFSNGHSVCRNCWAVRKSRHLLPLMTRGKIRDDLHHLGLELHWTCGQNRKQIIQTALSQNHQILPKSADSCFGALSV